ncbi:MAG: LysR substrate-binding domain-containing protein, partial [Proteobacteria bacterium]|nr:LysR substrate-binding domain-containing protein [Pseudomonadota bacterium]
MIPTWWRPPPRRGRKGSGGTPPEPTACSSGTLYQVDFAREDVDVAVRHDDGTAPGLDITRLCAEELFPECSPRFLRGRHALRRPADLAHHALQHLDHRQDWSKWLDAAGVEDADLSRGPVLNQASMVIDAAVDGQGVAAGTNRTCRTGPDQRPSRASGLAGAARLLCLLDRLPEGDGKAAQNRELPRLAPCRGSRRCAA